MKKLLILIFLFITAQASQAQEITGQWNGVLKIQGSQLRLVFNITKDDEGYQATMDSPDQGAKGIPVSSTTFEDNTLTITVDNIGFKYEGDLEDDGHIVGSFEQAGMKLPLDMYREVVEIKENIRPQEPKEPFPYYSEDVTFKNKKADIELAGTLTLPEKTGKYPVVVLISGSGPQNRNEELLGHKPFLVLSDYLTRNGIAVLRYDDRGTAKSTGDFSTATSHDFSTDVEAAIKYLKTRKEIDKKQIGLMGHSEGGIIAPMVASRYKKVSFIVLLAGTGIPGDELLLLQQQLIGEASGVNETELKQNIERSAQVFNLIQKAESTESLKVELTNFLTESISEIPDSQKPSGMTDEEFIEMEVDQITGPWLQYFIKHDPATILEKVKCPVFALNGSKDLQVPPKENLEAIEAGLKRGGNSDFKMLELPNLNHLFQESETGAPSEYAEIEQTFSPIALEAILQWLQTQIN
ncbi:MAG: alpha/beta fold hydrolase [Crocinitomicaceae bacterium]|nr:alpha/beta fold hydrolase [Crocinitomicaceae bacterium]